MSFNLFSLTEGQKYRHSVGIKLTDLVALLTNHNTTKDAHNNDYNIDKQIDLLQVGIYIRSLLFQSALQKFLTIKPLLSKNQHT